MKGDTSPVLPFSDQGVTCGGCDRDVVTNTILDTENELVYFTCPECGSANRRARRVDTP